MRGIGIAMLVGAGCSFTPGALGDAASGGDGLDANGAGSNGSDANAGPAAGPYRACAEALAAGITTSGVLEIDPDGDTGAPPFSAYCDMTTAGGGWTLVWVYRFTSQTYGSGAVTPRPTWGRPATNGSTTSVVPPLAPTQSGAMDFALWSEIGTEFLLDSNINSTLACTPNGGSLVSLTAGSVNCTMIKAASPGCSTVVPRTLSLNWQAGPVLKTGTLVTDQNDFLYFYDGSTQDNFPTHDPCGMDALSFPITDSDPRGAVYLR